MSDFLLELSKNPNARNVIKSLGLPIPMPQALARARAPWEERPLANQSVVVGVSKGGQLAGSIAETLAKAGAAPKLASLSPAPRIASRASNERNCRFRWESCHRWPGGYFAFQPAKASSTSARFPRRT